jgi:hypothetical protein
MTRGGRARMVSDSKNSEHIASDVHAVPKFNVYPPDWRSVIDVDLRCLLEEARIALNMDKAYMGFIDGEEGLMHYPHSLRLQEDTNPFDMRYDLGLVGLALTKDEVVCWPDDELARSWYRMHDLEAKKEITGPLHLHKRSTGTIWFTSHDEERRFRDGDKIILERFIVRADQLLWENYDNWTHGLEKRLEALAERCLQETASNRGYIAIEKPDKDLRYFMVGEYKKTFLPLTRFEGLCGRAFQTAQHINCGNVYNDSSYRPSHTDVRSELVVPIVEETPEEGRRSIGLINLESYEFDHYTKFLERLVLDLATNEARLVRTFRKREEVLGKTSHEQISERVLNGLVGFAEAAVYMKVSDTRSSGKAADTAFADSLQDCARQVTGTSKSSWWGREDPIPDSWSVVDISDDVVPVPQGPFQLATAVRVEGEKIGVLGIEGDQSDPAKWGCVVALLKSTARLGAAMFKLAGRADRDAEIISLTQHVIERFDDPQTLVQIVQSLPRYLESRHCTLFLRLDVNGRRYLVPGPSSCGELIPTSRSGKRYYDWDPADGPTAYAAVYNKNVTLSNLADENERRQFSPNLIWGKILAEEPGSCTSAFMACPISSLFDRDEVLGVIRIYRDERSPRTNYTDFEKRTFALFASLLGKAVESFCGGTLL